MSAYDSLILGETGLVSYYETDGDSGTNAVDSKDANTGTYAGGFTLGQSGIPSGGSSVLYNGTTGKCTATDANNLDLGNTLSIEAWVKPTALSRTNPIVNKGTGTYGMQITSTNHLEFDKWNTTAIAGSSN